MKQIQLALFFLLVLALIILGSRLLPEPDEWELEHHLPDDYEMEITTPED